MSEFSDYIVYVDESGDHDLTQANTAFPIFCLTFCVISKEIYADEIVPKFQKFKFRYFGHDLVVLHESDIRKSRGPFTLLLTNAKLRQNFYAELNHIIEQADVQIIASVIKKATLKKKYATPSNPYEIALLLCMERLLDFLLNNGQKGKNVDIIFESRGKREDTDLEVAFRRICDNQSNWGYKTPDFKQLNFTPKFVAKSAHSTGLQLADLTARPIALSSLRPDQKNRAYEIISKKLICKEFP